MAWHNYYFVNLIRSETIFLFIFILFFFAGSDHTFIPGGYCEPVMSDDLITGNDMSVIKTSEIEVRDIQTAYSLWTSRLAKRLKIQTDHRFYINPDKMVDDFIHGKISIINTSGLNYLRMESKIAPYRDSQLYSSVRGGKRTYRYLILCRSDLKHTEMNQLKGSKIIIKKEEETATYYLDLLMKDMGYHHPEAFFSEIEKTNTFVKAVLSVFFSQYPCCMCTDSVFDTMIELNPQVGGRLSIIHQSPELTNGVFFFHRNYNKDIQNAIMEEAMNLEKTSYGRQVLLLYRIDRIVQLDDADLKTTRDFFLMRPEP